MKRLLQTVIGCVVALSAVAQNVFTPGNLVVLQTSGTASKAGSPVTLKEFTTSGVAGMSVTLPTTGPTPFQSAGVYGGSEGFLTTSADGKYLVLGGYATTGSYSDITATTATSVPRTVGLVYPSGFYLQFDTSNTFYSANDMRGAVSDGTSFWAAGASNALDGIDFFGPGPHFALANGSTPPKAYSLRIFNGQIYYSTQKAGPSNSSSQLGIFALGTGLPTSGTVGVTQIINTGTAVAEDFSFNTAGSICYIAINVNSSVGGIQKWTKSGSTWSLQYTLGTGITNTGAYGLVVDYSGTNPIIYATTFDAAGNRVVKIVDNGSVALSTVTTLVAATPNVYYKGITFAPVASGTPLVNISVSSDTASEAGMSVITVTANTSAPVTGAQTVTLSVSGSGITSGDYTLSNTTITIPNGGTSGSVTFTVADDILGEGTETANLTLSSASSGLALGMRPAQHITIADNDGNNHPTIVMNASTTNYIDNGVSSPSSPFQLSGAINDPTDPGSTLGMNFTINDLETAVTDLIVWTETSNTTVVPTANIMITGTGASRNVKITPAGVGFANVTIKVTDGTDTTSYIINYAASAASVTPANTQWHTGMSDASDAITIDDNYFISADDELDVLNVYSRSASGMPVVSYNYAAFLSLPEPASPEADIEAAAVSPAHANRSYWMGSMSNGKAPFQSKPNRDRLFATTYSGTGAATTFSMVGYCAIKTSLLAWGDANGYNFTTSAAAGVDSKSPAGFAAEGMVFGPDNTTLYIGLRAPLVPTATRIKAVIAPILNFETWFNNGAPSGSPTYGAPIELDLSGRGIRDIIRLSNGTYIIVAGNPAGDPITSALYKWTGSVADVPILVSNSVSGVLNIEGAMPITVAGNLSLTSLQVVTDQGDDDLYGDGTEAKDFGDLIYRKFRTDIVTGVDLSMVPEINVKGNSADIAAGTATTTSTNNTDFGSIVYGSNTTQTFVVQNLGTGPLSISGISVSGTAAADFTIVSAPAYPLNIPVNGTYTVTVQFAPHGIGNRTAMLTIANNDGDEGAYSFAISGNGLCNTPSAYNVTGGGTMCSGGSGFPIGLSNSATGVNYQLYNATSAIGTVLSGNGFPLSFGTFTTAGTYSVMATDATTLCASGMTGIATISVNTLPTVYAISGGGNYCAGSTGSSVGLINSQTGVNYQLYNGPSPVGTVINGTGSPISFGTYTAIGIYTVQAINTTTSCVNNMSGNATIGINPLPAVYAVTGGGSYCTGSTGVHISLGGSTSGISYKLYNGSSLAATISGTGSPLDMGTFTTSGTYTVTATNASTTCVSNMMGSAIVNLLPVVTPSVTVTSLSGLQVCAGTTVNFVPAVINGGSAPVYSWRVNGTAMATTGSYMYVPVNGDVISLKITSNAACTSVDSATASLTMTVNPYVMPSASIAAIPGNILCEGSPVTFAAALVNSGSAPTYSWLRNSTIVSASSSYAYTPADGDEVILIMGSNKPCRLANTVLSNMVRMQIAPRYLPTITISANPGLNINAGTAVTLTAQASNAGPHPAYQWLKNGITIAGATDSMYTSSSFANNDTISCMVIGSGLCGMQSSSKVTMKVNPLGVAAIVSTGTFTIQPNPNNGEFYITGTTAEDKLTICVANMLGQIVHRESIVSTNGVLNSHITLNNALPTGTYLVSIISDSGSTTFRVVVE